MSGMLPGVECARRRRLHQSNRVLESPTCLSSSTRKSFFCLYTSNNSTPSMGSGIRQAYEDGMLAEVARQAKQRLDEKLRGRCKPDHSRNGNREEEQSEPKMTSQSKESDFQTVELKMKNVGPKKFSWGNVGKKSKVKTSRIIALS